MENQYLVTAYAVYLPITFLLTIYVSRTLFKNGRVFMLDIFNGRKEIAFATNKLFETGFYLLNLGMALLILKMTDIINVQTLIEMVSTKIGAFTIYLGIMLFLNLFLFFRGRKKSKANRIAIQNKIANDPIV